MENQGLNYYERNKTKILDPGIFEGLVHKNYNCVMNGNSATLYLPLLQ